MKYFTAFLLFWYDFIIGDDWRNAAATLIAIALTLGVLALGLPAYWVFPVVIGVYLFSLLKTT
ncbi:MAG: hypothetical protein RLY87_2726 [Chloroflexota bacterium]|jgi:hypothetical protein